ncbi:SOS response-associated peptidase [Methylocystis sp. B8]|uniref:SOS response-associated peptidase n=1 Tax=Methylocystis sp. B8 TaxID=544938 RepID=UPI0010FDCDEC|nr:SOS response-associated peptidase [Methylocystis sp. B8]TLG71256.1 SOS response-associated peptidase [Methylocystis sp. B8]
MCGRFTQHLSWEELQRLADLIGQPRNLAPHYNIAPTMQIEVIRLGVQGKELTPMRWGLVPLWWRDSLNRLPATFNARAETVAEKPMFCSAFNARRGVVPASGFYEWTGPKGAKTPHYFSAPDGRPLAFAGLWERAPNPDTKEMIDSATIIVGPANKWMSRFHDRMPVILDWGDIGLWMAGGDPGSLLRPPPEDALQEWVVSPRANKSDLGDDDPMLIAPV